MRLGQTGVQRRNAALKAGKGEKWVETGDKNKTHKNANADGNLKWKMGK